jgi:hypothetical protein
MWSRVSTSLYDCFSLSTTTAFFFFPYLTHSVCSFFLTIPTVCLFSHHLTWYWQPTCTSAHILWQFFQVFSSMNFLSWRFLNWSIRAAKSDKISSILPFSKQSVSLFFHLQTVLFLLWGYGCGPNFKLNSLQLVFAAEKTLRFITLKTYIMFGIIVVLTLQRTLWIGLEARKLQFY